MGNRCGECRFYTGKGCSATGGSPASSSSACGRFSAYGRDCLDDVKHCSDCRFYTGRGCSATGGSAAGSSSACGRKATCR